MIDKADFSLSYVKLNDAIALINTLGPHVHMCKTDITDAFKQVPNHPSFHGVHREDKCFSSLIWSLAPAVPPKILKPSPVPSTGLPFITTICPTLSICWMIFFFLAWMAMQPWPDWNKCSRCLTYPCQKPRPWVLHPFWNTWTSLLTP